MNRRLFRLHDTYFAGNRLKISSSFEIKKGILLIPRRYGTRVAVNDELFVEKVIAICEKSKYVLTLCTGSALIAKTGLLDSSRETFNKRAFDWVVTQRQQVNWIKKPRWTTDENFYTFAGVSAGMDMSLVFCPIFMALTLPGKLLSKLNITG